MTGEGAGGMESDDAGAGCRSGGSQSDGSQFEVYREVLEDLFAGGHRGVGVADVARAHRGMQAGHEPGSALDRLTCEHLRRRLGGSSEAVGA